LERVYETVSKRASERESIIALETTFKTDFKTCSEKL
jgi:hypothetical protein